MTISSQDRETQVQELRENQVFLQMLTRLAHRLKTRQQERRKALQQSDRDAVYALEAQCAGLEEAINELDVVKYLTKPVEEGSLPLSY